MERMQIQVKKKIYLYYYVSIIFVKTEKMRAIRRSIGVNRPHAVIDHHMYNIF